MRLVVLTGNLRDALNHLSRIEFIENQEVILWVGCFDISFLDRIWREVLQIEGNNQRTSRTDGGGKNVPVLRIVGQAREDVLVIIIDGVRKKTPDFQLEVIRQLRVLSELVHVGPAHFFEDGIGPDGKEKPGLFGEPEQ